MKTPIENAVTCEFPGNFEAWVAPAELLRLTLEAAYTVRPGSAVFYHRSEPYSESMLLSLLSYSYATGIYASGEIEETVRSNGALRYLRGPAGLDRETVRQFRRVNGMHIRRALTQIILGAWRVQNRQQAVGRAAATIQLRELSCYWEFFSEAQRRINRAVQSDCIAIED